MLCLMLWMALHMLTYAYVNLYMQIRLTATAIHTTNITHASARKACHTVNHSEDLYLNWWIHNNRLACFFHFFNREYLRWHAPGSFWEDIKYWEKQSVIHCAYMPQQDDMIVLVNDYTSQKSNPPQTIVFPKWGILGQSHYQWRHSQMYI